MYTQRENKHTHTHTLHAYTTLARRAYALRAWHARKRTRVYVPLLYHGVG